MKKLILLVIVLVFAAATTFAQNKKSDADVVSAKKVQKIEKMTQKMTQKLNLTTAQADKMAGLLEESFSSPKGRQNFRTEAVKMLDGNQVVKFNAMMDKREANKKNKKANKE